MRPQHRHTELRSGALVSVFTAKNKEFIHSFSISVLPGQVCSGFRAYPGNTEHEARIRPEYNALEVI